LFTYYAVKDKSLFIPQLNVEHKYDNTRLCITCVSLRLLAKHVKCTRWTILLIQNLTIVIHTHATDYADRNECRIQNRKTRMNFRQVNLLIHFGIKRISNPDCCAIPCILHAVLPKLLQSNAKTKHLATFSDDIIGIMSNFNVNNHETINHLPSLTQWACEINNSQPYVSKSLTDCTAQKRGLTYATNEFTIWKLSTARTHTHTGLYK
jgi:hypothetical protein